MRSVRSALVGLGTVTILLTFVGFATFSPDGADPRPDVTTTTPSALAADAGSTTGRVTAFVFANQLQSHQEESPEIVMYGEPTLDPSVLKLPTLRSIGSAQPQPTTTTQPPTTTTTPPAGGPLTEGEMRLLAAQFFPAEQLDKAVLVAGCESTYNPSAYNPAGPFAGLFQHSLAYWNDRAAAAGWAGASVYDATANTAVSAWLWARDGWGHWPTCSAWADRQLGG